MFGVQLEAGALEVLHRVVFTVYGAALDCGRRDGKAELGEATELPPVTFHRFADGIARLSEGRAAVAGAWTYLEEG